MHKTITITLAGELFHLEEPAYDKLKRYLDDVRMHFAKTESAQETDEIMSDIEARIAELLLAERKKPDGVMTTGHIDEIIKHLGTVADIAAFEGEHETEGEPKAEPRRRFYRDPANAMLAGVAAGIAAYFNIDPTIVRLVFVVLTFFNGLGIFAYIFLWIILPEARTPSERAAMTGEDFTLAAVRERVQQTAAELRNELSSEEMRLRSKRAVGAMKRTTTPLLQFINGILRAVLALAGFGIIVLAFAGLVITILIALALALNQIPAFIEFPLFELVYGSLPYFLFLATLFIAATMPLVACMLIGWYFLRRQTIVGGTETLVMVGIWIIAVFSSIALAMHIFPPHYAALVAAQEEDRIVQLPIDDAFDYLEIRGVADVEVVAGTSTSIIVEGPSRAIEDLHAHVERGTLRIDTRFGRDACFFCPPQSEPMKFTITVPELSGIEVAGIIEGSVSGIQSDAFTASVRGPSTFSIDIASAQLGIETHGASEVIVNGAHDVLTLVATDASRFTLVADPVRLADIDASDAAEVLVAVDQEIVGTLSDESTLQYFGEPRVMVERLNAATLEQGGAQALPAAESR